MTDTIENQAADYRDTRASLLNFTKEAWETLRRNGNLPPQRQETPFSQGWMDVGIQHHTLS